jgi:suppressor of G2 allele of SKP1
MSVLEQLSEAQGLYISGAYSLARDRFTQIIQSNADSYEAFLYRAHSNIKLNNLEDAVKDAEAAIKLNSNRSEALLVKGIALFASGKYDDAINQIRRAQLVLSSLEAADPRRVEVQVWEQKAEAEKTKKTAFSVNNLNRKPEEQKAAEVKESSSIQQHPKPGKISYKWHQTDNRVYIEINFALKKKEDLNITIGNRKVSISFPVDGSSNYELNLDLFDEIDAQNSAYNVHLNRIEVQLEKILKGRNWTLLERPDSVNEKILETVVPKPVGQDNAAPQGVPSYPSSSKTKKDWSKIDREIEEDMKKNKDDYADEDPLNKFFKEIYKNSDENTRKAMMKSFQTSGGTVLSTNWDEVKQKDYEGKDRPDAPNGQEYKEWGK